MQRTCRFRPVVFRTPVRSDKVPLNGATDMSLSREQVEKVSVLARLKLSPAELETMTAQLAQIVGYVELLGELDTENVEPLAHALDIRNVFRDDTVGPSLTRDAALSNAPDHDGQYYHVPAVLGE